MLRFDIWVLGTALLIEGLNSASVDCFEAAPNPFALGGVK